MNTVLFALVLQTTYNCLTYCMFYIKIKVTNKNDQVSQQITYLSVETCY